MSYRRIVVSNRIAIDVPRLDEYPDTIYADDIPAAVAELDKLTADLQAAITAVADDRACLIAELASTTSVRQAADDLALSPAAVSKAVARSHSVTPEPTGAPS